MRFQILRRERRHNWREVTEQFRLEHRLIREIRAEQVVVERHLGVGQDHGQLRPREAEPERRTLPERLIVGQELDRPVQPALPLQRPHHAHVLIEQLGQFRFDQTERQGLQVVVLQHESCDRVGHRSEELRTLLSREPAGGDQIADPDLDVHFMVGGIDPGGVVYRVRVDPAAAQRVFDSPALGHSEVCPLPHDLRTQLRAVQPYGIIGAVPGFGLALRGRLDVVPMPPKKSRSTEARSSSRMSPAGVWSHAQARGRPALPARA